ncbi:MAG: hypothetical protein SWQ30_22640 [Thermodesulfobacteriota bacterium]|nr:hypothetical protein [Thermodesulfobacteriota bacterium]
MRKAADDADFKRVHIYEMDSLQYFNKHKLNQRLPSAQQKFDEWYASQKENTLLEELYSNITFSEDRVQLIKLRFVELMIGAGPFITVLPQAVRYSKESIRFIELLEEYFKVRIAHVAIIPSVIRFAANLCYRRKLFDVKYIKLALEERKCLILKRTYFDSIIKMPLWSKENKLFRAILKQYIGC